MEKEKGRRKRDEQEQERTKRLSGKGRNNSTKPYTQIVAKDSDTSP